MNLHWRPVMLASLALFASRATGAEIVVSPSGSDQDPGTSARPVRTLGRALEIAVVGKDKRIVLRSGRYALARGLRLDRGYSGIAIRAKPGVVLTGGFRIAPSSIDTLDADLAARLPKLARTHAKQIRLGQYGLAARDFQRPRGFAVAGDAPCELIVGNQAQRLAQWPNDGMIPIARVIEGGDVPREEVVKGKKPQFTIGTDRPATWGAGDVWAYGYWKWDWADESIPVERIEGTTVSLMGPHHYGLAPGQPIRFENVLEELDQPGEYATAGDRLVFWPTSETEPLELTRLSEPLISLVGAEGITLDGLTFENSRGRAVDVAGGLRVTIERCTFRNLGLNAVSGQGGKDLTLRGCTVEDTGEGGFFLDGGDRTTLAGSGFVVVDCSFRRFMRRARTYRPAVKLNGVGITIRRCEFREAPHSAIIFSGNDHLIERCRFVDLLSDTGDGGAVYGGRDWTARGTVIRENLFARIRGMRKWENAVYLDDQLSGITVERNVFIECHWAMLIGGGRENIVRDNLLLGCTLGFSTDDRGLGWAASSLDTMKQGLAAVPVTAEPWRTRFPDLVSILDDQPMAPLRNTLERNVLVRSGSMADRLNATFNRLGTVRDNPSLPLAGWSLTSSGLTLGDALREAVADRPQVACLERLGFGVGTK